MNNEVNVISVFPKTKPSEKGHSWRPVEPEVKYPAICNVSYFERLPFLYKMM